MSQFVGQNTPTGRQHDHEVEVMSGDTDYKALLAKYIAHLYCVEGVDFIDTGRHSDIEFTQDEIAALRGCADAADALLKRG